MLVMNHPFLVEVSTLPLRLPDRLPQLLLPVVVVLIRPTLQHPVS